MISVEDLVVSVENTGGGGGEGGGGGSLMGAADSANTTITKVERQDDELSSSNGYSSEIVHEIDEHDEMRRKSAATSCKTVGTDVGTYKIERESAFDDNLSSGSCLSCCRSSSSAEHRHKHGEEEKQNGTNDIVVLNGKEIRTRPSNDKRQHSRAVCCCRWLNCKKSKYMRLSYYRNNLSFFVTFIVYCMVQILLGTLQFFYLYKDANIAVRIARVGGILIDFNSGLVVLLVLRRLTTWIRNSVIGRNYLPIDESIKFHKFIGLFIFFLSFVHTAAHCVNLYWLSAEYKLATTNGKDNIFRKLIISLSKQNTTNSFKINATNFIRQLNSSSFNTTSSGDETAEVDESPNEPGIPYIDLLFTTKSNIGWIFATAMPTGWILIVILLVMVFFSMPFIRKKGLFQVFYLTHWLHIFYFIVLLMHAANFWKWFLLPFVLLVFERIFTCFRVQSTKYGDTYIRDVRLLSSKVTQLVITRPPNFKFRSGDYIFIKIPKLARYEWHPFTISSAPELQGELWLHIRSLGNWTNKLYEYFQDFSKYQRNSNLFDPNGFKSFSSETKYERKMSNLVVMVDYKKNAEAIGYKGHEDVKRRKSKKIEKNLNISNNIKNIWMDIAIDGPYSTASRRIFDSEQVILIAGGIGVTPFASILQSLWFKYSKSLKTCEKCDHQWYDELDRKNLKKVDFIWVNRDYQAFEWFIELLGQLELQQINSHANNSTRFIGIHLYMTSATVEQEIRPLDNPEFNKNGQIQSKIDHFGLKLNPGRPDFEQLFTDISDHKKGKEIDVFFCGNREFGKFVQKKCITHKFKFYKEYF